MSSILRGGVDIGGTNIRVALFNEQNKIEMMARCQTNPQDWRENVVFIVNFFSNYKLTHLGVGMTGPSNYEQGIFISPPNLHGWWGLRLRDELDKKLNRDIIKVFANDANLMALAVYKEHGLTTKDILQFYTISTGLGAGLIIKGAIFNGAHNMAQEIAMMPIANVFENNPLGPQALE